MSPLTWAFILLTAAFVLLVVEMFVPSHGIIGAIAAICVAAAVVAGFYQNAAWGVIMLAISAVSVPVALWAVFYYWPQTPIGQKILIKLPTSPDEVLPESYKDKRGLIGKIGVAKSKMLLGGAIQIDGKTYDAVSEALPIEPNQEVQVVAINMNRIMVRALDPNRPREVAGSPHLPPVIMGQTVPQHVSSVQERKVEVLATAPASPEDLLARSAASFGLDDLPELGGSEPKLGTEGEKESDPS